MAAAPVADDADRIAGLDFLRGLAVLGILVANVVSFGLPTAASVNPFAAGLDGPADSAAWLFSFLLVDGKMRALFALLFGASMLLVMESAAMDGRDGVRAHRHRMYWLLAIGLAHHLLLWSGDILLLLGISGLLATWMVRLETLRLLGWALAFIALQWAINLAAVLPPFWIRDAAHASAAAALRWSAYADALGYAPSTTMAADVALHLSGYGAILTERVMQAPLAIANGLRYALPETLGFMALGMAMLKGGFLAQQWSRAQYGATAIRAYLAGLVPMAGLAAWVLVSQDPLAAQASAIGWSVPLRLPITLGNAALGLILCDAVAGGRAWLLLRGAIIDVGRLALSAYLFSSLVMTTLFYGYGAALFGSMGRAALIGVTLAMCALLLALAALYRKRWRQGPAEWLWRRLARGREQMR